MFFRILILVVMLAFSSSCAAAQSWWVSLETNPVSTLQQDISYISNAIGLADAAFFVFEAADPTDAARVKPQYYAIEARVRQSLALAMDTLQTAADAQAPAPDPNVLLADSRAALTDLQSLISALPGNNTPGHAASPEMQAAQRAIANAIRVHPHA